MNLIAATTALLLISAPAHAQDPEQGPEEAEPSEEDSRERPEESPAADGEAEPATEPEQIRPEPPADVFDRPTEDLGAPTTDIWDEIDELPPRYSYDLSVQVIYGQIAHWTNEAPWWPGLGLRGAWGPNVGNARISIGALVSAEGPIPEFYSLGIEPQVGVDTITNRIQLGVSAGVGAMFYGRAFATGPETSWGAVPSVSARVGYSDSWTRIGRRFFVLLEPKMRYTEGVVSTSVALVVGSGRGA